jgi:hypothetical protein
MLALMLLLLQASTSAAVSARGPALTLAGQGRLEPAVVLDAAMENLHGDSQGWQTVFSDSFDSGIGPGWIVTDTSTTDGGEYVWDAGSFEPGSPITAAWCVGGGADGSSLTPGVDNYPANADAWLIRGPVELTRAWDAYVRFTWWMEGNGVGEAGVLDQETGIQMLESVDSAPDQGDWLGWCVLTDTAALEDASCSYVKTGLGAWMYGAIPLQAYLPVTEDVTNTVWIAFRFVSDGDDQVGKGAFVDDVALRVNRGYSAFLPLMRVRTPEPTIEWDYPVITTGSKIGVHALRSNEVKSFAQELVSGGTRFPVVKGVDDFGWMFEVATETPESIFVGRRSGWGNEGCHGVLEWDEAEMTYWAGQAIGKILEIIDLNPGLDDIVDYWEPYNEPDPPGAAGYRQLAELQKVTMDIAEDHGLKLALFSLNAGTPEWDEMEAMVETGVFARAREGGHILALHEGTFVTHDPTSGWGSTIPGSPIVEGAGALNFRYRYLYHLLEQRGEVVPLVVSEWYCGDEQSASTQTLIDALAWYDGEASKDYYFLGTLPFTLGPTPQWTHTDYERVYEGGLIDYMIAIKTRENGVPPGQSGAAGLPAGLGPGLGQESLSR